MWKMGGKVESWMRRWAQESVDQERGLGEILDSCQQTQGIPKAMSQVKSNKGVTMNRGEESSKNKPPTPREGPANKCYERWKRISKETKKEQT